jgi:hypothetical protein
LKIKGLKNYELIPDPYIHFGRDLYSICFKFYIEFIFNKKRTNKVLDYQKTLLSAKKSAKIQEIRDQFNNVTDENAIILNNRLEEIER